MIWSDTEINALITKRRQTNQDMKLYAANDRRGVRHHAGRIYFADFCMRFWEEPGNRDYAKKERSRLTRGRDEDVGGGDGGEGGGRGGGGGDGNSGGSGNENVGCG
ncbi:hypothetical protein C1645_840658 [Glomus cerebriforme]|uniref:Uncharacterized protein n=1 Tax=Glomus cerebriforme TaxID=658196 RepID=A0A397S9Q4_9GLOM|nr:hypothetical protein C1645_840658 [Glomus cerebriforme]